MCCRSEHSYSPFNWRIIALQNALFVLNFCLSKRRMFQLSLKKVLWGAFWIWLQLWTHEWEEDILLKQRVATVPLRISRRGWGRVIWGPWAPCTAILLLIRSFRVSYVTGICKAPKTKIEGLFRFSDCPLGFFFFLILHDTVSPFIASPLCDI